MSKSNVKSIRTVSKTSTSAVVPPAFEEMSLEALRAAVTAREAAEHNKLQSRVAELRTELASAESALAQIAGTTSPARTTRKRTARKSAAAASAPSSPKRKPGRPKGSKTKAKRAARASNEVPLNAVLHQVMPKGSEFTVKDALEALDKTDFKTNANNKYVLVYTALSTNEDMFKKTGRGVFTCI